MDKEVKDKLRNKEKEESSSFPALIADQNLRSDASSNDQSKTDSRMTVFPSTRSNHHADSVASPRSENMIMMAPAFHASPPSVGASSADQRSTYSDGKRSFDSGNAQKGKKASNVPPHHYDGRTPRGHQLCSSTGDVAPSSVPFDAEFNLPVQVPIPDDDSPQLSVLVVAAELSPQDDDTVERQIEDEVEARIAARTQNHIPVPVPVVGEAVVVPSPGHGVKRSFICTVVVVVALIIVVSAAVTAGVKTGNDKKEISDSQGQGSSPSTAPTTSADLFRSILDPWIVRTNADSVAFENATSPQSLALEWLLTDPISLSNIDSNHTVLERYVMAVLFFSTSLEKTAVFGDTYVCNWISSVSLDDMTQDRGCQVHYPVNNVSLHVNCSGLIPWELSLLTNLVSIHFDKCEFSGPIPSEIGQLTSLRHFWIENCNLNGALPTQLGQLTALEEINLTGNDLTGPLPSEMGNLASLRTWVSYATSLTGKVPTEIGQLESLITFAVSGNDFTGPLPTELGQLSLLEGIWIDGNKFSGPLPTELGQLMSLITFAGSVNNLTGPIPTELGQLSSLTGIWIDNSHLTGTMPTEFGKLIYLENLAVSNNELTGPLPSQLGLLTSSLHTMSFNHNFLTGTVPTEFAQLSLMTHLFLKNNSFTGSVDEILCISGKSWKEFESDCLSDNLGYVEIACSCCTVCCDPAGINCS